MSSTMGPCVRLGAAKAMGLFPIVFRRPPHGAMPGKPLVQAMPIMSCGKAIMAKCAQVPMKSLLRADTKPMPCARALLTARSIARAAVMAPNARSPSSKAVLGASLTNLISGWVLAPPLSNRSTRNGRRMTPCECVPRKSASTKLSAMMAASRPSSPDVENRARTKVRSSCAETRAAAPLPMVYSALIFDALTTLPNSS